MRREVRAVLTALFIGLILYASAACRYLALATFLNALALRAIGRLWGSDWDEGGVPSVCPRGSNA